MKCLALVLAICAGPLVFAQAPTPAATTHTTPAVPVKPATATPAAPTELETTQLENLELKWQLLSQEEQSIPTRRQELNQQYTAIIQKIQAEHPGYTWNPTTRSLLPSPTPSKPAVAPKKEEAPKK